ncbi:MAG: chitobiase/beta-hexosaminidase C-terminal domain-containing protein [Prevotella sp.]|nr:chitobiase/beta-hexosaminidase C-terminal domain-containing protein [Prevotella sp.]
MVLVMLFVVNGSQSVRAQGWPEAYNGVMLQGFFWDSYSASQWSKLEGQADDLAQTFSLVWVPQSGNCGGQSMGYDDLYWFTDYNSSFGTEAALRSMISTFKAKGMGTIADVVINHRKSLTSWTDFPKEVYKGVTYQLTWQDICSDDEAARNGYQCGPNKDTGEGWDGMRDLDHKSENVQTNVKAYLDFLLNDLGYTGFRYDMVKGYSAEYTRMYNTSAQPQFSVGEYWDSSSRISNWIDGTAQSGTPTSAAFDFQFRYTVRNAANNGDWTRLGQQNDGNWPLVSNNYKQGNYFRWAVTFVENHDTERRAGSEQDPLKKDTLAANAYLLAMPGTPCVFLKHWQAYKPEIKAMVEARRVAGINNMSTYANMRSNKEYYSNLVKTNGENRLLFVVGKTDGYVPSSSQWKEVLSGYHYKYYLSRSLETAWANRASGTYDEPFDVTLTAVSASDDAQLVYTLDGTTPTASSTKVADGTTLHIDQDCTLTLGVLVGGAVKGIVTRAYTLKKVERKDITVYVNTDQVGWTSVNFWTWGGDDTHAPQNANWPGDNITQTTSVNGKTWFYKTFTLNSDDDYVNFVFSTGSGSPQTVDVENVRSDKFFEISTEKSGNKNLVVDVTSTTGISVAEWQNPQGTSNNACIYSMDGRLVRQGTSTSGLPRGLYLVGGRKVVVK